MELYGLIWAGLLGLAIGSFLNVVIYRLPRKLRFLLERSICPRCRRQLRWYHNIPLVSYLFLRGRCGFCHESISLRYPSVELANALFYVFFYWQFGLSLQFLVFAFLGSSLLAIFLIDLEFQIIPDVITIPGMAIGLTVSLLPDGIGIGNAAIGLLVGGGSLYLIALLGDWLFKKDSMGGGDIKMAGMLGAFLGWQKVLFIFMASAVIGLGVSLIVMIFSSRLRRNRVIPFGPFLATAALLSIVYGDRVISYYVSNFLTVQ
ncbi:MAG: prepilin peptidase [candidate division Zixibacteria bacterium]|nr:prepilin peptidase [candidate division Zixibacteria bacterium]